MKMAANKTFIKLKVSPLIKTKTKFTLLSLTKNPFCRKAGKENQADPVNEGKSNQEEKNLNELNENFDKKADNGKTAPNYTDFTDFMQKDQARKSTVFSEAERKEYSHPFNENADLNSKKTKAFENAQAQRKMNQSRNFISQRKNLSFNVKKELQYFKLDENFKLDDLRKKYLFLAKLYHPDSVKNDIYTSENFNQLRNNYEKLKVYFEMREKLVEMEKNIEADGTIVTERQSFEWTEEIGQPEKQEIIKELILENQFGDIKEPKYLMQKLMFVWFLIGSLVFVIEFKKFLRKYKVKRNGVDYGKYLSEYLF